MAFIKALVPGALLTWIVAGVIGSRGSSGGMLAIEHVTMAGHSFYWSWSLFIAATGLAWGLFTIMD